MTSTGTKTIVVSRHGQKDGDRLTETGYNQMSYLHDILWRMGIRFVKVIWSGAQRTHDSARVLLQGNHSVGSNLIMDVRAGMEDLIKDNKERFMADYQHALGVIEAVCKDRPGPVVSHYLTHWNAATTLKERLEALMAETVQEIKPGEAVLISSHGPTAELATMDPENHRMLREGEAMVYIFSHDNHILYSYPIFNPYYHEPYEYHSHPF